MDKVYIKDSYGNNVLPVTHVDAVLDSSGNSVSSILGSFSDRLDLQDSEISLLNGSDVEVVANHTGVVNPDPTKIYREPEIVTSPAVPTYYKDWMWDSTESVWKEIAQYNFPGIDTTPTPGSQNLVESGGVFNSVIQSGIFDLSAHNSGASYASLSAALTALNNLSSDYKKGGMSIRYIESVSGEYVQYHYMSTSIASVDITNTSNWQGVDDEPTAGSRNLVESGGIVKYGNYATNLFNKDDTTIVHGKSLASDGRLSSTEGFMVSHFIPFDSDFLVVVIDNSDSSDSTGKMAYYDANYNLLSEYTQSSRITTRNWAEGIAYVRFTLPENAEIQISKGFIGLGADKFLSKVNVWGVKDILEYYYDAITANLIDLVVEPKPFIKGYTNASTLTYTTSTTYKSFWLPVVKGMTLKVKSTYNSTNILRFGIYSNFPNYYTPCLFESNYNLESGTSEKLIAINYTGIAILSFANEPQSVRVSFDSLIEKAVSPLKVEFDLMSNLLQYNIPITESLPGYYTIKGQTVGSEFNNRISGPSSGYKSYAVDCVGGERFIMNINVGSSTGRYAFTDENDIILVVDGGSSTMTDVVITAPANAKHLYYVTRNELISYKIKAGEYDLEKLENMASKGNVLGSFRANGELANGESLTLPVNYTRKNVSLFAEVYFDTFTSVEIGLGKNNYRGMWFIVTPNDVSAYWSESGAVLIGTYEHGLTLEDCFTLSFDRYINSGILKIYCKGDVFTQELTGLNFHGGGAGSITNNSESAINASVSVFVRDANEPVYIFGDSYLSFTDNARWPYYALQAGYTHWFSDSLPGASSSTMIAAFKNDITLGTPKIAVWCLGMNDGADPDVDTPNSNWLLYAETFVSVCEENKIIPVFGITPTIPTKLHHGKAKWIRESGYRYIDFAKAVNAQSDGTWYSGMLSSDGVHPTTLGAKALAHRAFIDLPEISVSLTI